MSAEPDRERARALYARAAAGYDASFASRIVDGVRRRALARVGAAAGDTVLDVACGTGINFPGIQAQVGPSGRLIGVELSPEMLAVAHRRVAEHGWENVTLVGGAAEGAKLPDGMDRALFSFTHDVLQSPAAVAAVAGALRDGGRAVACGTMDAWRWAAPFGAVVRRASRPYITAQAGFGAPWAHLGEVLHVEAIERPAPYLGSMYVVSAVKLVEHG